MCAELSDNGVWREIIPRCRRRTTTTILLLLVWLFVTVDDGDNECKGVSCGLIDTIIPVIAGWSRKPFPVIIAELLCSVVMGKSQKASLPVVQSKCHLALPNKFVIHSGLAGHKSGELPETFFLVT
jgi:hypothetical protein